MSYRKVSVITLTSGSRSGMLARVIKCVSASTYPVEHVIFDTREMAGKTIGAMRNAANATARGDIVIHADDDDIFHPRRIEEQVALLQSSGKDCVGYRECLFWDTRPSWADPSANAWLYTNPDPRYVIGASMCCWRSAWEACPFDDAPHEDQRWWLKNASKCLGVSCFGEHERDETGALTSGPLPRLICGIHGDNTSPAYSAELMANKEWRRAPEWDRHAANVMQL